MQAGIEVDHRLVSRLDAQLTQTHVALLGQSVLHNSLASAYVDAAGRY